MPARMNPRDWDRLFRPNTPRRGGPLWAFTNVLIVGIIIGVFVFGLRFALQYNTERVEMLQATQVAQSTAQAATAVATQTAEAGLNATAVTAESQQATLFAGASGVGNVVGNGGNLRSEPVIAPETVLGQVCPGDQVAILEEQSVGTAPWYRIRVVELSTAPDCQPARRIPVGNEGWISSTLISPPGPVPSNGSSEPAAATDPGASGNGLILHETTDFTIGLPAGWEVYDLNAEERQARLAELERRNPRLFQGIDSAATENISFFAVDTASLGMVFEDNVNIGNHRAFPVQNDDISEGLEIIEQQYAERGVVVRRTRTDLTISGQPAAYIEYTFNIPLDDGSVLTVRGYHYLVFAGSDIWVLTYSVDQSRSRALEPFIEQSAFSFQLRR